MVLLCPAAICRLALLLRTVLVSMSLSPNRSSEIAVRPVALGQFAQCADFEGHRERGAPNWKHDTSGISVDKGMEMDNGSSMKIGKRHVVQGAEE
jgi:hypothetical protein